MKRFSSQTKFRAKPLRISVGDAEEWKAFSITTFPLPRRGDLYFKLRKEFVMDVSGPPLAEQFNPPPAFIPPDSARNKNQRPQLA